MQHSKTVWNMTALTALMLAGHSAQAQRPIYDFLDLGSLNGGSSSATGINNYGQVVGSSTQSVYVPGIGMTTVSHPFIYSGAQMTDLVIPPEYQKNTGGATGINDSGQVVGYTTSGGVKSFLYSNGAFHYSKTVGERAINNAGQSLGSRQNATLYQGNVATDLGTLGGYGSTGYGLNNLGQAVGEATLPGNNQTYSAFLYSNGQMQDIGKDTGLYFTEGHGISDNGIVAGVGGINPDNSGSYRAFVWQNGQAKVLGTLGGNTSFAFAVNNAGTVIGSADLPSGYGEAFVYQNGQMYDLFAGSDWSGGTATAINNKGQIVGNGYHNGHSRAFLATPRAAPAPSSLLVAGLGLILLAGRLRRNRTAV